MLTRLFIDLPRLVYELIAQAGSRWRILVEVISQEDPQNNATSVFCLCPVTHGVLGARSCPWRYAMTGAAKTHKTSYNLSFKKNHKPP
jgi:hypothetical protein